MPTMQLRRGARLGALMALLVLSATCENDDLISEDQRAVAGLYVATQFVTDIEGMRIDQLARGSTITLSLDPSRLTSGRLIIIDPIAPENVGLEGQWALFVDHILLDLTYDSILDSLTLAIRGSTLVAEDPGGSRQLQLVLTRQSELARR